MFDLNEPIFNFQENLLESDAHLSSLIRLGGCPSIMALLWQGVTLSTVEDYGLQFDTHWRSGHGAASEVASFGVLFLEVIIDLNNNSHDHQCRWAIHREGFWEEALLWPGRPGVTRASEPALNTVIMGIW